MAGRAAQEPRPATTSFSIVTKPQREPARPERAPRSIVASVALVIVELLAVAAYTTWDLMRQWEEFGVATDALLPFAAMVGAMVAAGTGVISFTLLVMAARLGLRGKRARVFLVLAHGALAYGGMSGGSFWGGLILVLAAIAVALLFVGPGARWFDDKDTPRVS